MTDDQPVSAGAEYLAGYRPAAGGAGATARSGVDRENSGGPGSREHDDGFYADFRMRGAGDDFELEAAIPELPRSAGSNRRRMAPRKFLGLRNTNRRVMRHATPHLVQ